MSSFSFSESQSFTLTHAKQLASKVAADLKRIQRFYGQPSDADILKYESELTILLRGGFLREVTYGFQLYENWIEPSVRYTAKDLNGMTAADDDPGRISASANTSGASFNSFLCYSQTWFNLTQEERDSVYATLPFRRGIGSTPGVSGYIQNDKSYTSGGRSLDRGTVKSY